MKTSTETKRDPTRREITEEIQKEMQGGSWTEMDRVRDRRQAGKFKLESKAR